MAFVNEQFNRVEQGESHFYYTNYGFEPFQEFEHKGIIKCKLAHARWGSVVVPDLVFLDSEPKKWIQPINFMPCVLCRFEEDEMWCGLYVDISCGNTIRVVFNHRDLIGKLPDGSELFHCHITGPKNLVNFATGEWRSDCSGIPEILLYHHTKAETKPLIIHSNHLKASAWNIQGNLELENVNYVYFTCLDKIIARHDLEQIAMSVSGRIWYTRDGFKLPPIIDMDHWRENYKEDILEIEVYRESTENRSASIALFIPSHYLASQHLLFHRPADHQSYYEICKPFIQRVAVAPGESLELEMGRDAVQKCNVVYFDHLIAGDATNLDGLKAPFDEENTKDVFKIERTPECHSLVSFWFENGNSDLYSTKEIEKFRFKSVSK